MTTVKSGFIWTCWKLQRQLHVTHHGSTKINAKHWLTDCSKGSKSNHTDTFSGKRSLYVTFWLFSVKLLCHQTSPINVSFQLVQQISMVFWKYTSSSIVHVRLGWCWVDGVQIGTISVLRLQSNQAQKQSSRCVAIIKIDAQMSGDMGSEVEVEKEFPYLFFPFKVDQFKSKIKTRNYQVKKNTAKMLLYLHTMIFLKTRYIFTETKHMSEKVCMFVFLHIKFFIFTIAQIVPSASVPLQARSAPLDQNESRSGEPCLLGCSLFS